MRPHYSLLLVLPLLLTGCAGDRKDASLSSDEGQSKPALPDAQVLANKPNLPRIEPHERDFEWNHEKIAKRHAELVLAPLPEYAEGVRGVGGLPRSRGHYSDWGFIVPKDQIPKFKTYLLDLGIPDEFISKQSPYSSSERDSGWQAPAPAAEKLIFRRSVVCGADVTYRGLSFRKGLDMIYVFENPNLENSDLHLMFSGSTGGVRVMEKCINW